MSDNNSNSKLPTEIISCPVGFERGQIFDYQGNSIGQIDNTERGIAIAKLINLGYTSIKGTADIQGVWFRESKSLTRGTQVVEIWYKSKFIGTINIQPHIKDLIAISITSKHLQNHRDKLYFSSIDPAVLSIVFSPLATD